MRVSESVENLIIIKEKNISFSNLKIQWTKDKENYMKIKTNNTKGGSLSL